MKYPIIMDIEWGNPMRYEEKNVIKDMGNEDSKRIAIGQGGILKDTVFT